MMTPVFEIFDHDLIDPLFLQNKIDLPLSHLVPQILGPKGGLIFHQNVLFLIVFLKNFVLIFSLIFNATDPHFH